MNRSPTVQLADPDIRPQAAVIIYDGHCRFCRQQVERLAQLDRSGRLAFLSLHDPRTADRYPDLTYDQLMQNMYLIDARGNRHRGAAVVRYLSRHLPALWPLAPLLHLPGSLPIWQFLYQCVARQRYRWGRLDDCENGSCALHFGSPKAEPHPSNDNAR